MLSLLFFEKHLFLNFLRLLELYCSNGQIPFLDYRIKVFLTTRLIRPINSFHEASKLSHYTFYLASYRSGSTGKEIITRKTYYQFEKHIKKHFKITRSSNG